MKSKHTPGPWKFHVGGANGKAIFYIPTPEGDWAYNLPLHVGVGGGETDMANARLIAAAPELLAALKEAIAILGDDVENAMEVGLDAWLFSARAVVAKAEGREE